MNHHEHFLDFQDQIDIYFGNLDKFFVSFDTKLVTEVNLTTNDEENKVKINCDELSQKGSIDVRVKKRIGEMLIVDEEEINEHMENLTNDIHTLADNLRKNIDDVMYKMAEREKRNMRQIEYRDQMIRRLMDRVRELEARPKEYEEVRTTNLKKIGEASMDDLTCLICLTNVRNVYYNSCGHAPCCGECYLKMKSIVCPICRKKSNQCQNLYV